MENAIFVGGGGSDHGVPQHLRLRYATRHGLIAGATGTGKTVTLQILAESLSEAGVPVLLTDIKGDLSGLAEAGSETAPTHAPFAERSARIGLRDFGYRAFPVTFWDIEGRRGHPVRSSIAEIGPLLLARLLELSAVQEGVLNIAFRVADEQGLPLLDLKDLQAMLVWLGTNRQTLSLRYGNVAPSSIGAIQRRLLMLESEGAAAFFAEPALELGDLLRCAADGRGRINILAAERLMAAPRLYATVLLWLLSELYEQLPEIGDTDRPKLVLFLDEAHLVFDGAPDALLDKIEQVTRLIRSKGVGIFYVTQDPGDIPEDVLGQLGNRVQHALRAFTAKDRRALSEAAATYRDNPDLDIAAAIREVGTGEAVTSFLEDKGIPGMAERTLIRPPRSRLGPISESLREIRIAASDLAGKYDTALDRDSAFEKLQRRAEEAAAAAAIAEDKAAAGAPQEDAFVAARRYSGSRVGRSSARRTRTCDTVAEAFAKSFARQLGSKSGQAVVRGVLGGLFRGR